VRRDWAARNTRPKICWVAARRGRTACWQRLFTLQRLPLGRSVCRSGQGRCDHRSYEHGDDPFHLHLPLRTWACHLECRHDATGYHAKPCASNPRQLGWASAPTMLRRSPVIRRPCAIAARAAWRCWLRSAGLRPLRTTGWFHFFERCAAILFFFLLLLRVLYKYLFLHKDRAIET
jgi:hypothetical protein